MCLNQFAGSDGTVKQSDIQPKNKYHILADGYSLNVTRVTSEDSGNYTCQKTVKALINGSMQVVEDRATMELVVQGRLCYFIY